VFGFPDVATRTTRDAIKIPWVLGLIATRSLDTPVEGIAELVAEGQKRIVDGLDAYRALETLRRNPDDASAKAAFAATQDNLGYALLLRRYRADIGTATPDQIAAAANDLVPNVPVLFWGFRVMAGFGFYFIALFAGAFYLASVRRLDKRWFLRLAVLSLPLPWVAIELGWVVAEYGRQPWAVEGVLPTFLGASSVPVGTILGSIAGFVLFYSALAVVDLALMVRTIRRGPGLSP
jgi:cytochrome d ubiquinol oxidase subunit I